MTGLSKKKDPVHFSKLTLPALQFLGCITEFTPKRVVNHKNTLFTLITHFNKPLINSY